VQCPARSMPTQAVQRWRMHVGGVAGLVGDGAEVVRLGDGLVPVGPGLGLRDGLGLGDGLVTVGRGDGLGTKTDTLPDQSRPETETQSAPDTATDTPPDPNRPETETQSGPHTGTSADASAGGGKTGPAGRHSGDGVSTASAVNRPAHGRPGLLAHCHAFPVRVELRPPAGRARDWQAGGPAGIFTDSLHIGRRGSGAREESAGRHESFRRSARRVSLLHRRHWPYPIEGR
jgi:hypothetical protein